MIELPTKDEVSITAAAHRLRVSYHEARTMMLRGEIAGRQIGRLWYVATADVERLASAGRNRIAQPA